MNTTKQTAIVAAAATPPAIAAKPTTKVHHHAMPAKVTPSPTTTTTSSFVKTRGHTRSASLENANSFISKNTLGLPVMQSNNTGTLKSRNEQKRMRNKFGSHNNLDDYVQQGRSKFQNIRQMFEFSKKHEQKQTTAASATPTATTAIAAAAVVSATPITTPTYQQQQQQHSMYTQQQQQQQQQQLRPQTYAQTQQQPTSLQCHAAAYQQQYAAQQQQLQLQQRRPTPTTGCGNRNSMVDLSERLSVIDGIDLSKQHLQQQQQQLQQQHQNHQQLAQPQQPLNHHQQQQQQQHILLQQQRSASGLEHLRSTENLDQATSLLRPIAFKPIPFEPDYSIPNRYCDVDDHYGSTPSLAPVLGSSFRFGSTTDLRHGGGVGVGFSNSSSSSSYCNSLMARRRGSRSLKINDSMESIRHTPDSDATSQSSTIKSTCSNSNIIGNNNNSNSNSSNNNNKYMLSEQCDMTPSPSDSGISDLEAALKDRDSELSYLRQTMEHNEKDKETFWENETKRLKTFYEGQQREYLLKIKKMEQMLAMQQFQFKQNKLRLTDSTCKIKEQMADLKNENEILRNNNNCLKSSERNLKDRAAFLAEKLNETDSTVAALKTQLEESEWKVCERNGEIALLKTQLKEANVEITMKEHALVHLKNENTNTENQMYQSLQENNNKLAQQQRQDVEQQAQSKRETETELKQLNKIIILKDQVILALTNELAKLRKELSDLAISHEYGEEPSGKYTRLKHQLDNLTDICNRTRRHALKNCGGDAQEKAVDDTNLEVIMNCLKIAPPLTDSSSGEEEDKELASLMKVSTEQRLAKMSADIQKFVYGSQNLPDVTSVSAKPAPTFIGHIEESELNTLIEESSNYASEIAKLRRQLDDVRENFEMEKLQWCEEREKVLSYQKQLQTHYINMYQKLRSLQKAEGSEV